MGFWSKLFVGRSGHGAAEKAPARPALLVELVADKGRLEADLEALRAELLAATAELRAEAAAAREDSQAATGELADHLSGAASGLGSQVAEARAALAQELAAARSEVNRLGREQFRVSTLLESQGAGLEKLEAAWREHQARREREVAELRQDLRELADGLEMRARFGLLQELLPVMDALGESVRWGGELLRELQQPRPAPPLLAFLRPGWRRQSSAGSEGEQTATFSHWLQGVQLVQRRLGRLLEKEGAQPIPALGQPFDPHLHVAIAVEPIRPGQNGVADGTVVREELTGYLLGDRVLRHAEVVVARLSPGDALTDGTGPGTAGEQKDGREMLSREE